MNATYRMPFRDGDLDQILAEPHFEGSGKIFQRAAFEQPRATYELYVPEHTIVVATRAGVVLHSNYKHDHGRFSGEEQHQMNFVIIAHDDQTQVIYAHIFPVVKQAERVAQGQIIGLVGGYVEPGMPHIHLQYYHVKPFLFGLSKRVVNVPVKFNIDEKYK